MTASAVVLGRFGRSAVALCVSDRLASKQRTPSPAVRVRSREASEPSVVPLASVPDVLTDWQVSRLASAIAWQGTQALEWIDARTAHYRADRIWTKRQARLAAGLDWELRRLQGSLQLDLRQRQRSVSEYFHMHQDFDQVCDWIDKKKHRSAVRKVRSGRNNESEELG